MNRGREEILTILQQNCEAIRSYGVRRLGLFGSYARGEATDGSDLDFVVEFEKVQEEIRRLVDLPDRLLRLFVRVAVHNGGKISGSKRAKFDRLSEAQISAMEEIVLRHLPKLKAAADLA